MRCAGAEPRTTVGFPALLSPWRQPTEAAGLAALVAEDASRATILSAEEDLMSRGELWPRGEELLAIAVVPSSRNGWGELLVYGVGAAAPRTISSRRTARRHPYSSARAETWNVSACNAGGGQATRLAQPRQRDAERRCRPPSGARE